MAALPSVGAVLGAAPTPGAALPSPSAAATHAPRAVRTALLALFLVSGAASLVYQVVWQRQLAALFGGDAAATATTLAVFFAGLGAGSWLWGERSARTDDPLRTYALLEGGIALAAVLATVLLPLHHHLAPLLLPLTTGWPVLEVPAKMLLAASILAPTTVLIGGTLPVLGQVLVRSRGELARTTSLLTAVNTLGAAGGAVAAGFWMQAALGLRASTLVAAVANLLAAALALAIRGRFAWAPADGAHAAAPRALARSVLVLAAASGFAVIALEVLWTRMLALVLNSSTYAFASILVVILLALACGAALAHAGCRLTRSAEWTVTALLVACGAAVGATPFVFHWLTNGLGYLRVDGGFTSYVVAVFAWVALVTFVPATLCGAVLPSVVRLAERDALAAGPTLGRLLAANTAGGIAGALAAGFVLLPTVGLWGAIRAVAILYLVLAIVLAARRSGARTLLPAAIVLLLAFASVLDPARLASVRLDVSKQESLHEQWSTPHGTVAVIARPKDLVIEVDGSYTLGGIRSRFYEETQADIPLLIAHEPRSAFFLGLGTGITAGAALRHPVERVTATELVPEVALASRKYFGDYTNGLFSDPRARVVIGDGRHVLLADPERYDVIVSDLFVPWHAGTGSLYTREHFATVRERLTERGVFAQWLPLYQMSRRELDVIVRSMLDVFPQVTLWRGDFLPRQPIVALVGQSAGARLEPAAMLAATRAVGRHADATDASVVALAALLYAGNLTANADLFVDAPPNTDDHPILEALAARTQSEVAAGERRWLVGRELVDLYARLDRSKPPGDPYLAALDAEQLGFVRAGEILYRALVAIDEGDQGEARRLRDAFRDLVPYGIYEMFASRLARADRER